MKDWLYVSTTVPHLECWHCGALRYFSDDELAEDIELEKPPICQRCGIGRTVPLNLWIVIERNNKNKIVLRKNIPTHWDTSSGTPRDPAS